MSLEPWKAQRIGNLRERITFIGEPEEIGRDEWNLPIFGPPVEETVHARVEPIKGDELMTAGTVSAYHEVTFHVRYRSDIKATWSIQWNGSTYNVTGWRNLDERRRYLSIEAKAVSD